jgi:predicted amidophosphoribosyltransferase
LVDLDTNEQTCARCGRWFYTEELTMGYCEGCQIEIDMEIDRYRDEN